MINQENWSTKNIGLAKYMLENGELDNLLRCCKVRDNQNHLLYLFKRSDTSKKLYNEYMLTHEDYREPTLRYTVPKLFWCSNRNTAKKLLEQGCAEDLLGYKQDMKEEGSMIFLFAKTDKTFKLFLELQNGKEDEINE